MNWKQQIINKENPKAYEPEFSNPHKYSGINTQWLAWKQKHNLTPSTMKTEQTLTVGEWSYMDATREIDLLKQKNKELLEALKLAKSKLINNLGASIGYVSKEDIDQINQAIKSNS